MNWRTADHEDYDQVLDLVRAFYQEEGIRFDAAVATRAVAKLLDSTDEGVVLLAEIDNRIAGYLIATRGFSIEFGGRFVLLDELYVSPEFRSRGAWKAGLQQIEAWAKAIGASSIRLEVNHHNETAHDIYLKSGFQNDQRHILTKWLSQP